MTLAQHAATHEAAPITVLPALADPDSASESNHRIANSLQLLAAMVSVEARRIVDPAALAAFEMTLRRIGAIASVHRHLYQSPAAASVDLGAYIAELSADLERSFGDDVGRRIVVMADPVTAPPEDATSIGIIVSELVGNACKYAYAPGETGDIRIVLQALPFGGYRLDVADRGRGIEAGAAVQGTGLGSRLIAMMAGRLGARHAWHEARPGTCFTLHVPKS
ncbi:sensor histidine kinase [Sphingomonas sp. LM7]|uniref:sensor histidine kinase n=1 Tax=Sphingomonas sp. LM7 TaxID=1938607 RepID=UPI000983CC80|nr:sensor histidine kinase [Sphingomonas sp. LM7]AQR72645.1 hypothetical protein BXU08_02255 [Sphingomonas sp. LM7]